MSKISLISDEVEKSLAHDFVGLWEILRIAKKHDVGDFRSMRAVCEEVLRQLLVRDVIRIGDLCDNGFVEWSGSTEALLQKIRQKWDRLPGAPNIGDICWLDLKPS